MNGKESIEWVLKSLHVEYVKEYRFHPKRRFRYDYAIPKHKIAVEYEGIYSTDKSRHTTVSGYTQDTTKYNLSVVLGWRVLRYTAVNIGEFHDDIKQLLCNDI